MFTTNSTVLSKDITSIFASLSSTLGQAFNSRFNTLIKKLFANNEQGVFYDPFDMPTMYQDAAGISPVSSPSQPLGLMLDKSKGLAIGSEKAINGDLSSGLTGWLTTDINTTVAIVNGRIRATLETASNPRTSLKVDNLVIGNWYTVKIDFYMGTLGTTAIFRVAPDERLTAITVESNLTASKSAQMLFRATATTMYFGVVGLTSVVGQYFDLDNVSVKELAGNHARQTTSAARPLFMQKPILGNNYIVNGTFATDVSGWGIYLATATKKDSGVLLTTTTAGNPQLSQARANAAGKTFLFSANFKNRTGTSANAKFTFYAAGYGDLGARSSTATSGTLSFIATIPATVTNGYLICMMNNAVEGASVEFSDVRMDEIVGYHTDKNYLEFDGVDDKLLTTFAAPLTNCTVVRAVPNEGTKILYNQTLPASYEDTMSHSGFFAINRALSSSEKVLLLNEIDKRTGITSLDSQVVRSFANNEAGVAFNDFNDMSVLFQDAVGTIPATAVGQPVGLVLDKSKGLLLGNETIIGGDFENGLIGVRSEGSGSVSTWELNTVNPISGTKDGKLTITTASASRPSLRFPVSTNPVIGKTYRLSFDYKVTSGSAIITQVNNGSASTYNVNKTLTGSGTFVVLIPWQSDTTLQPYIYFGESIATIQIDNVSFKELAGNHAYQTASASRPLLGRHPEGGARNLLSYSGTLTDASLLFVGGTKTGGQLDSDGGYTATKLTGPSTSAPTKNITVNQTGVYTYTICLKAGAQTTARVLVRNTTTSTNYAIGDINLITGVITGAGWTSKAKPNGFWECVYTTPVPINAGEILQLYYGETISTAPASFDIIVDYAQLEVGSVATNYQETTTLLDITEKGKASCYYLKFDGVDDFLQTNNIDFTSTDKVSVFAGVRKLSDAATGALVGLSSNPTEVTGSFEIFAPSLSGTNKFQFAPKGTDYSYATVTNSAFNAPVSVVISAQSHIANDVDKLRLNGSLVASSNADQGTGNYGNYPMYIGRRGGTSLPFNGHLYSLIIMGRLASDTETAVLENAIAKQVGVTLNV